MNVAWQLDAWEAKRGTARAEKAAGAELRWAERAKLAAVARSERRAPAESIEVDLDDLEAPAPLPPPLPRASSIIDVDVDDGDVEVVPFARAHQPAPPKLTPKPAPPAPRVPIAPYATFTKPSRGDRVRTTAPRGRRLTARPPAAAPLPAPRPSRSPIRWPIFVCAFIAGVTGGMAFMDSPFGQRPETRASIESARQEAIATAQTAVAALAELARNDGANR